MPSCDIHGPGVGGRPEADDRSRNIIEGEFRLGCRGGDEPGSGVPADRARVEVAEAAVDTHREEQVVRIAQRVELSEQIFNRTGARQLDVALRAKAGDDGEGDEIGVGRLPDRSGSWNSPETPVDDNHLAVEIDKGAQAKVAMALQLAYGDDTL